eukprot:TRINITY_DN2771_c0_g1_i3.p1 TRINITY_DN2771_c0_g1~~TRINITY_DN2771_c0_g1_i3.p1  ORF type:complete len:546 (+),score=96.05 TRINITY_DN2771_c0_g1_i3:121-1758(+)
MDDLPKRILNVNVGILGHVDSGKTSLAKVLSTLLSTAALDKSPASKERGITLDLGFSAFQVPIPPHMSSLPYDVLQFTLVDCPGHSSLIRTIIGGAQIIDLMLLVIDGQKGIQTQTAECLVIGEITCRQAIVVINKIDLFSPDTRQAQIDKMSLRLSKTLQGTSFKDSPIVPVSANSDDPINIPLLVETLQNYIAPPVRKSTGDFLFEFDHCFPIKGQGTVLTGTVLSGSVELNKMIEIPSLKVEKKVKSMQMFHRPVEKAIQGDRVGICVAQLDAKLLERGIIASPKSVPTMLGAIVSINKVRFFKSEVKSKQQFHITIGHQTIMGSATFFGPGDVSEGASVGGSSERRQDVAPLEVSLRSLTLEETPPFDPRRDYQYQNFLHPHSITHPPHSQFALLEFEQPVICPLKSLFIGSRLDSDIHANNCRIAFYGKLLDFVDPTDKSALFEKLKIYKIKTKKGVIERVHDPQTLIGKDLFKKETDMNLFVGMQVTKDNGEVGIIESSFGKTGKFKVAFRGGNQTGASGGLTLNMKRYVFDPNKKNVQ